MQLRGIGWDAHVDFNTVRTKRFNPLNRGYVDTLTHHFASDSMRLARKGSTLLVGDLEGNNCFAKVLGVTGEIVTLKLYLSTFIPG